MTERKEADSDIESNVQQLSEAISVRLGDGLGDGLHAEDTLRTGNRNRPQQATATVFDIFGKLADPQQPLTVKDDPASPRTTSPPSDTAAAPASDVPDEQVDDDKKASDRGTGVPISEPPVLKLASGSNRNTSSDTGVDDVKRVDAHQVPQNHPPPSQNPSIPMMPLSGDFAAQAGDERGVGASPPPPPPPMMPPRSDALHKRTVSWGAGVKPPDEHLSPRSPPSTASPPRFPPPKSGNLERGASDSSTNVSSLHTAENDSNASRAGGRTTSCRPPLRPGMSMSSLAGHRRPHHEHRRSSRLTATDLAGLIDEMSPLESEAEASILKIIEERDAVAAGVRARLGSTGSHYALTPSVSIIENIPDEAVSTISGDDDADSLAGISLTGEDDADAVVENRGPAGITCAESMRSLGSSAGTAVGKPKSSPAASSRKVPTRGHRRTQTMEEQLSGLATAIDAVHAQRKGIPDEDEDGDGDLVQRVEDELASVRTHGRRQRANDPADPASAAIGYSHVDKPGSSSHDAFQRNAGILYHRMKRATTPSADHGVAKMGNDDNNHTALSSKKKADQGRHHKKEDAIFEDEESDEASGADADVEAGRGSDGSHACAHGSMRPSDNTKSSVRRRPCEWKCIREFQMFFEPIRGAMRTYAKVALLYVMIPSAGIAAILFYVADNPPTGVLLPKDDGRRPALNGTTFLIDTEGQVVDPAKASASWWILFVFVRQTVTLTMALLTQVFVVDFMSIHTGITFRCCGAWPTLLILQSRGWPFVAFFWGVFDFALLSGDNPFVHHWLYFQNAIGLFNETNPSGNVLATVWNYRVLSLLVCVSVAVSVKRLLMGVYLGKKTFVQFSDKLTTSMKKILLISEVAFLARDIERKSRRSRNNDTMLPLAEVKLEGLYKSAEDDNSTGGSDVSPSTIRESRKMSVIDPNDRHPLTGKLNATQEARITRLLGSWEEPVNTGPIDQHISVNALLQFRRALTCLRTDLPFSASFGPAGTREDAITSAQEVYERLLHGSDDPDCLNFRVLGRLGIRGDGTLEQQKLKELIRLFRPDRDGALSMVDFVKSVDTVYRELRLLRASVDNSSKIDSAFENLFNIVFFFFVLMVGLAVAGVNLLELFLSVSAVIVAFAFSKLSLGRLRFHDERFLTLSVRSFSSSDWTCKCEVF